MNEVKVVEDDGDGRNRDRPFMVKVNGILLRSANGVGRRFKSSIKAAVAGAKEVDRLRPADTGNKATPFSGDVGI